jgi:isocitrate dehydrogenase (NAD+)
VTHAITLIPGDGIGPEVTGAVVQILEAAGLQAEWDPHLAGCRRSSATARRCRRRCSIRSRNKVALKGPVTTPVGGGFTSVNVGLRKALNLFANLRPVWNIPSVPSRYEGVDLVIVRENTEDLYSGLEHEVVPGVVESLKIITERGLDTRRRASPSSTR